MFFLKRFTTAFFIFILSAGVLFLFSGINHASAKDAEPKLEMDIKDATNADGVDGISVNFFVKGTPAQVWKYLSNMDYLGKLFPAIEQVTKVRDIDANTILWKYNMKTALGYKIFNVKRSLYAEKFEIQWIRTDGDLTYYGGGWKLIPSKEYPGWVDCTYENYINAGWYIPYWKVKNTSKENAEAMVPALRKFVAEGK